MKTRHDEEFGLMTTQGGNEWVLERTVTLGGAPIPIEIELDEENFSNPLQRQATRTALALDTEALEKAAPAVVQNYEVYRDMIGDAEEMPPLEKLVDVWQQVEITSISISPHLEVEHAYFLIRGECDWDPEHGLEVRFRDGVAIECSQAGETGGTWDNSLEELEEIQTLIDQAVAPWNP